MRGRGRTPHCGSETGRLGKGGGVCASLGSLPASLNAEGPEGRVQGSGLLPHRWLSLGSQGSLLLPRARHCLPSGFPWEGGTQQPLGQHLSWLASSRSEEPRPPSLAFPGSRAASPVSLEDQGRDWCWEWAVSSPQHPGRCGPSRQGCEERARSRRMARCAALSVPAGTGRQWSESEMKLHAVTCLHFHLNIGFFNRNAVFRESWTGKQVSFLINLMFS